MSNSLGIQLIFDTEGDLWQRLTAEDLRLAIAPRPLGWNDATLRYTLRWRSEKRWEDDLQALLSATGDRFAIIVSSRFAQPDGKRFLPSAEGLAVRELCKRPGLYGGLIALTAQDGSRPAEIDSILPASRCTAAGFGEALATVATSLWLKAPPLPVPEAEKIRSRLRVEYVKTAAQLRQCFELRFQVYRLLGYLKEEVERCQLKIEMDCYDNDAIHLIATDPEKGRLVGCARLILPSRWAVPELTLERERRAEVPQIACDQWCRALADEEPSRVFRRFMDAEAFSAMPGALLKAVRDLRAELRAETKDVCELSRLIVAPDCRGLGVSKLLVKKASDLAAALGRKYLILECGPHHQSYYEGLGFKRVHPEQSSEAAQTLNQVALPMYKALPKSAAETQALRLPRNTIPLPCCAPFRHGLRVSVSAPQLDPAKLNDLTQTLYQNLRGSMKAEIERPEAPAGAKGGGTPAVLVETRDALAVLTAVKPLFEGHRNLSITISNHAGRRHVLEAGAWHTLRVHALAAELQGFIESSL